MTDQATQTQESMLDPIEKALEAFAAGEFLVVVDDEDRENEGDLIIAGDAITEEKMAFMIRHTSGVICAPLLDERAEELRLVWQAAGTRDRGEQSRRIRNRQMPIAQSFHCVPSP